MKKPKVTADYHRNGVGGNGFIAAIVEDAGKDWPKRCLCIALPKQKGRDGVDCFVLDLDKAAEGDIAFGSNSWRGDNFSDIAFPLIEKLWKEKRGHPAGLLEVEE